MRKPHLSSALVSSLLLSTFAIALVTATAARAEEQRWERKEFECKKPEKGCYIASCCQDLDFSVYTREKEGTPIKEVKSVGDVDAPPARVFLAVSYFEHQVGNMPYVKDQKVFSRTDNEVVFWTVADFPLVSARDWILKAKFEKNFDGGKYRVSWEPTEVKDAPPVADGVVRLAVNTGNWLLEPIDGGTRTRATYYLFTDPGGSIPGFVANKANTTALPDLFAAVRKGSMPGAPAQSQPDPSAGASPPAPAAAPAPAK